MDVAVADATDAITALNATRSLARLASKFVPVIVTAVPAGPLVGENDVIAGAADPVVTVNTEGLLADPPGAVTATVPVAAPEGTVTITFVVVALVAVAAVPLNVTASCDAVADKPVPAIVTVVPTGPLDGESEMIETCDVAWRPIDKILPTAS
jgi:hypothetical protein